MKLVKSMRSMAAAASLLLASGVPASAGSVNILNCFGASIQVATYNSNDGLLMIAYKDACVPAGRAASLSCATSSCKVKLWQGCPGSLSNALQPNGAIKGSWIYHNGSTYPMDVAVEKALSKGVVAAGTKSLTCEQFKPIAP